MFGGVQTGWIGDRSVPITRVLGNLSATVAYCKLLRGLKENERSGSPSNGQRPQPVPRSTIFCECSGIGERKSWPGIK